MVSAAAAVARPGSTGRGADGVEAGGDAGSGQQANRGQQEQRDQQREAAPLGKADGAARHGHRRSPGRHHPRREAKMLFRPGTMPSSASAAARVSGVVVAWNAAMAVAARNTEARKNAESGSSARYSDSPGGPTGSARSVAGHPSAAVAGTAACPGRSMSSPGSRRPGSGNAAANVPSRSRAATSTVRNRRIGSVTAGRLSPPAGFGRISQRLVKCDPAVLILGRDAFGTAWPGRVVRATCVSTNAAIGGPNELGHAGVRSVHSPKMKSAGMRAAVDGSGPAD